MFTGTVDLEIPLFFVMPFKEINMVRSWLNQARLYSIVIGNLGTCRFFV